MPTIQRYQASVAVVRRYTIRQALLVRPTDGGAQWDELVRQLRAQKVPVRFAATGDRVRIADLTFAVLDASGGHLAFAVTNRTHSILMLQSLGDETPILPASRPTVLVYPWRRTTFDPAIQTLKPQAVIYGDQPGVDPERSFAERRSALHDYCMKCWTDASN